MQDTNVGRRGFTLAELMVVIVILGLLATLVVKNVVPALFTARRTIAKTEIQNIAAAIDLFTIKNGRLPENLDVLIQPDENGVRWLKDREKIPLDPWGFEYWYKPDDRGYTFEIGSYGKDGEPGGEGDNEDMTNRTIANERKGQGQ